MEIKELLRQAELLKDRLLIAGEFDEASKVRDLIMRIKHRDHDVKVLESLVTVHQS